MPNWCSVTYKCFGPKKEINALKRVLDHIESTKKVYVNNGFGKRFLGCVIHKLGFDYKRYCCRGEIVDYYKENDALVINQSTAWCEQPGFRIAIQEKFPNIKVSFLEIELGCCVFGTNDPDTFNMKYIISTPEETEYFDNIEEVASYVSDILDCKITPTEDQVDEAINKFNDKSDDVINFYVIDCYD